MVFSPENDLGGELTTMKKVYQLLKLYVKNNIQNKSTHIILFLFTIHDVDFLFVSDCPQSIIKSSCSSSSSKKVKKTCLKGGGER
jgi:hypothetical protein